MEREATGRGGKGKRQVVTLERIDLLELDIDTRLHDLWQCLWDDFPRIAGDEQTRTEFAVFMRAAYGRGYIDALKDKGTLCTEHGYGVP